MTEIEIGPQSQTSTHGIGPGDSFGGSVAILWTQFFVERFKLVSRVRVEPTEGGSNPHTQAYLLARELHGQGDGLVTDAVHWALNMAGCRSRRGEAPGRAGGLPRQESGGGGPDMSNDNKPKGLSDQQVKWLAKKIDDGAYTLVAGTVTLCCFALGALFLLGGFIALLMWLFTGSKSDEDGMGGLLLGPFLVALPFILIKLTPRPKDNDD